MKRMLDICICLTALLILLPVLVVIVVIIKIGDKGPAIFRQERAGKDGKPFTFYKFRTMKLSAEPFGQSPTSGDDPRLIKAGKFSKKTVLRL